MANLVVCCHCLKEFLEGELHICEKPPPPKEDAVPGTLFGDAIQDRFEAFHRQNPAVYETLRRLITQWRMAGHSRCSISMLFEVMRWEMGVTTQGDDPFQLNNDFRSRYVRRLILDDPSLRDFFERRRLRT